MLVRKDFREFLPSPSVGNESTIKMLGEACMVVDALGDEPRAELLSWFIRHHVCSGVLGCNASMQSMGIDVVWFACLS